MCRFWFNGIESSCNSIQGARFETKGSARVPVAVAVADSEVNNTNGEHNGQPPCKGYGLMVLSLLAIPSREQNLRPRAILGSA